MCKSKFAFEIAYPITQPASFSTASLAARQLHLDFTFDSKRKKSLRRRVARQQSKSNDPPTSETIKSILDRRVESIAVELATFPSSWNEGCGKVLARLIRFWTEGRGKEPELGGYQSAVNTVYAHGLIYWSASCEK